MRQNPIDVGWNVSVVYLTVYILPDKMKYNYVPFNPRLSPAQFDLNSIIQDDCPEVQESHSIIQIHSNIVLYKDKSVTETIKEKFSLTVQNHGLKHHSFHLI